MHGWAKRINQVWSIPVIDPSWLLTTKKKYQIFVSCIFMWHAGFKNNIFFFSEGGYAFYDFLFGFYEALHCLMLYFQLMLIVVYLHDYRIVDHDSVVVLFS